MVRGVDVALSPDGAYVVMRSAVGSAAEVRRTVDLGLVFCEYDTFSTPCWWTETTIGWRRKHPSGIFVRGVTDIRPTRASSLPSKTIKDAFLREGHILYLTYRGHIHFDIRRDLGPGNLRQAWISGDMAGFMEGRTYHFSDQRVVEIPEAPIRTRFLMAGGRRYFTLWSEQTVQGFEDTPGWRPLVLDVPWRETSPLLVEAEGQVWLATLVYDAARNTSMALVRPFGATAETHRLDFGRFVRMWDLAYDASQRQLVFAVEGNYHTISIARVRL